jgi:hypothetical protein
MCSQLVAPLRPGGRSSVLALFSGHVVGVQGLPVAKRRLLSPCRDYEKGYHNSTDISAYAENCSTAPSSGTNSQPKARSPRTARISFDWKLLTDAEN